VIEKKGKNVKEKKKNEREGKRIVSPGALLPSHLIKCTGDDEWDRKRK
jgi:hypothetical protein